MLLVRQARIREGHRKIADTGTNLPTQVKLSNTTSSVLGLTIHWLTVTKRLLMCVLL